MGKQGPCYHCGVSSTPLWRNGPPEKPVLCNACGSRWRTKGTLANYTPLHARLESDDFVDYRGSRLKNASLKNKEPKMLKRKQSHDNVVVGAIDCDYNQKSRKAPDEDTSNRSSSGSAMSNSDSCVQFGSGDASDLTGPAQSIVWDTMVPSRKRTCVNRPKQSPVEKLTKDLYTILHEQSSHFSGSSEEDLLFESDAPMVSVEIGHGSVLIRHPSSIAKEEESEASSLSVDNKIHPPNEAYSCLNALPLHTEYKGAKFPSLGIEKSKKPDGQGFAKPSGQLIQQEELKRDKSQHEKPQLLGNCNSPLRFVDLKDVINFDEFTSILTNEEQQQLMKYLPPTDTARLPDSLKSMFASAQFKENLSSFQKRLVEGVFDLSFSGAKAEECRTLCKLTKAEWVQQHNLLKDIKCKTTAGGCVVPGGVHTSGSVNSTNIKRPSDVQYQNFPGAKSTMKSPKRMIKGSYEHKELTDNEVSCFSPRSLFALPPDNSSLTLDSLQFMDESSDQDLLLEVPSNTSFPQAELLLPTSSFGAQPSTSSSSVYPQLVRP